MKFGYTIVYVANVLATIEFYEKAFRMKRKFIHESGQYGELDTGATTLSFAQYELVQSNGVAFRKAGSAEAAPPVEIAFVSEAVEQDFKASVAAGASAVKAPETKPWGQTVAYVKDLNGFLVEICSEMNSN